jgi:hypothetical protein
MEPLEAVVTVLAEDGGPLHWTVIQDRALRSGRLDPFEVRDVRRAVLAALREGVRSGAIVKDRQGTYRLP